MRDFAVHTRVHSTAVGGAKRRRIRRIMPLFFLLLLMLCIGSCAMPLRTYAQTVQKASSLKQARKKKLEGITKIKKDYYYLVGGKPLTSREGKVIREEKAEEEEVYRLFVDRDGKLTKGWHQIGHRLYYCREKGIIKEKGKVDGLLIGKYGYVTATKEHLHKVMGGSLEMTSAQIISSIAGSASGKSGKLRAAWNFMSSKGNFGYVRTYETFNPGSARSRALNMLRGRHGNCYDFACAFAALAKAIGYDAYVVYGMCPAAGGGMTTHGWTYLVGAGYFDVEGNWAGWGPGVYGYGSNPYSEHGRVKI